MDYRRAQAGMRRLPRGLSRLIDSLQPEGPRVCDPVRPEAACGSRTDGRRLLPGPLLSAVEADNAGNGEDEHDAVIGVVEIAHDLLGDGDQVIDGLFALDNRKDGPVVVLAAPEQVGDAVHEGELVTEPCMTNGAEAGAFQNGDARHFSDFPRVEHARASIEAVDD